MELKGADIEAANGRKLALAAEWLYDEVLVDPFELAVIDAGSVERNCAEAHALGDEGHAGVRVVERLLLERLEVSGHLLSDCLDTA
jgi:hypothetical protein